VIDKTVTSLVDWCSAATKKAPMTKLLKVVGVSTASTRRSVLLHCSGSADCGDWVEHVFIGRELVNTKIHNKGSRVLYQCKKCGHEQQFGLEE